MTILLTPKKVREDINKLKLSPNEASEMKKLLIHIQNEGGASVKKLAKLGKSTIAKKSVFYQIGNEGLCVQVQAQNGTVMIKSVTRSPKETDSALLWTYDKAMTVAMLNTKLVRRKIPLKQIRRPKKKSSDINDIEHART